MEENGNRFYSYSFKRKEFFGEKFDSLIQYTFEVPCTNKEESISYLLNFYRVNRLLITDVFPAMWEEKKDKCIRFTSHEGWNVNFRKISLTSAFIFMREFVAKNAQYVMVISGSYAPDEEKGGVSRKLNLYYYFFKESAHEMGYRIVGIWESNAFLLVPIDCESRDNELISEYLHFKERLRL